MPQTGVSVSRGVAHHGEVPSDVDPTGLDDRFAYAGPRPVRGSGLTIDPPATDRPTVRDRPFAARPSVRERAPEYRSAVRERPVATDRPAPARPTAAGTGVPGRRTVTIQGRGSERYNPSAGRRRPARRPHERDGFRPDRAAMWAVLLGLLLVLAAATSSHAAVIGSHTLAASSHAAVIGSHTLAASSHALLASFHPAAHGLPGP